jgi:uncharacterized protein YkwD
MKLFSALTLALAFTVAGCASASHTVTPAPPTQPGAQAEANASQPQLSDEQIAQQLLEAINQERTRNHLQPLTLSPDLAKSAQEHSDAMQRGSFLSTKGESEQGVFARMSSVGVKATYIGENVVRLRARSDRLANEAVGVWMNAPADRKNMLSASFTRTGIGLSRSPDGDYYITQDFAH